MPPVPHWDAVLQRTKLFPEQNETVQVKAKAHFLRTRGATKVTIWSAGQQLNFNFGTDGVSISVVTEEPPEQVVGGFKTEVERMIRAGTMPTLQEVLDAVSEARHKFAEKILEARRSRT